jgi:hypothetical protein
MALLDPKILELLAQSGEQSKSARPTGLLSGGLSHILSSGLLAGSTFKPRADESWSDRLFGTNDPRDARGDAMMALSTGLLRGSFADGLDGYNRALREGEDRNYKRTASNMALGKNALELQSLITTAQRDQSIRTDLNRLQKDESAERTRSAVGPMLDRQPTDEYGTAGIGGVPMFSMKGPEIFGSQPAATYQPPQPQGAMRGAVQPPASNLTVGTQPSGMGQSRGNYTQGLSNRFVKQAEVYASNGDFERANKLYEQAAKWMPEVHKIEVAMQDNKPVNVITMKDGSQVLSPFSPTPKTHWADTGGAVQAIDEYSMQPRGTFKKSMTPGETASNQVAWANNRNATERLTFDRSQAGKPQLVDGAWHYPPSASNPQGSVIQPQLPAGMSPKLTEVQANATQFATRMRDASNVIDGFEKKVAPGLPLSPVLAMTLSFRIGCHLGRWRPVQPRASTMSPSRKTPSATTRLKPTG